VGCEVKEQSQEKIVRGFKFLNPNGATIYDGKEYPYILPQPGEKWGAWFKHPDPAKPDRQACGYGGWHISKRLNDEWGKGRYPWFAEGRIVLGEDEQKIRVVEIRLRRVPRKLFEKLLKIGWGKYSTLRRSDLSGSDLSGSDLSGSNLSGSNLRGSDLSGSNLSGSDLRGSDLSDSNLSGSDLSDSNLRRSNLSDSDLSGSNLSDSNLSDSDLSGSDLSGSDLRRSDLRRSNLRRSDLRGSDLSDSNLNGSDLNGSNLRRSDLRRSNLRRSDLRGSDLSDSNLNGSDLSLAYYLAEAILKNARFNQYTKWPKGFDPKLKEYGLIREED
jgi:uncharacterized protein YjbI with pentapeptide repeats